MEITKEEITIGDECMTDTEAEQRLAAIRNVVRSSNLVIDERHVFRETPDRLILSHGAKEQFEDMGDFILAGFMATRRLFLKAKKGEFPEEINRFIANALESSIAKAHRKTLIEPIEQLPLFFRADCVLANSAEGLSIKVTEVEGERSIAFGFATLVDHLSTAINLTSDSSLKGGLGIGRGIETALEEITIDRPMGLILGEDQLFYLPEQELFVRELNKFDIPIHLIREKDLEIRTGREMYVILPEEQTTNLAVSLPIFNQQKSGKHIEAEMLRLGFIEGKMRFLLPPFKFFGTKSAMGLMHQPFIKKLFLEEGLTSEQIDKFIPLTNIIAGQISEVERLLLEIGTQTDPPTLIKAVGMTAGRGMAMPEDREGINALLKVAKAAPFQYITQSFIDTIRPMFRILDPQSDQLKVEPQFMRLAAFFANIRGKARLLTVAGTGLSNPFVHGNPKCIMFPVVFKKY